MAKMSLEMDKKISVTTSPIMVLVIGNYTQDSKGITDLHASGGSIALSRVASGASDERQCNTTSMRM